MGLFTRRGNRLAEPVRDGWQPDTADIDVVPGYAMGDDGCAGEDAYGVTFIAASAPGPAVTVWTYAIYAAPDAPADYQTGWRCEHRAPDSRRRAASWTHVFYGCYDQFYGSLATADRAAWESAHALAAGGLPDDGPAWGDWDGVPW